LQVGPLGKWLHNLLGVPNAAGHVHDTPVADDVGQAVDLPEELGLQAVNILPLPQPGCHHGGPGVDKNAPGQNKSQGLINFKVYLSELPL
jgi:hypothetical protein